MQKLSGKRTGPGRNSGKSMGTPMGQPAATGGESLRYPVQRHSRQNAACCASVFFAARPMAAPASFHSTERMIPMEKKTPLYPIHLDEGGKMVPFAGHLLPVE